MWLVTVGVCRSEGSNKRSIVVCVELEGIIVIVGDKDGFFVGILEGAADGWSSRGATQ